MKTLRLLLFTMLIATFSSTLSAQKKLDPTGSWTFIVEQAPEEYDSGDIVVGREGEEFTVKIIFGENYQINASGVKYENSEISLKIYIEGETIPIKGIVGKESLEGTAITPDGTITFTAKKKK